ncbi:MAG: ATP12 family protein [Alphaproteobacteria bacterium]
MKRFYKKVAASPVEGANYEVHLDGRPVRTPIRHALQLPGAALARAVADEWDAQGEEIDLDSMPLTRIAATALDRVGEDPDGYVGQVAAYAETDLVCYRAPSPSELVLRQSTAWEPLLDWAHRTFGVRLAATEGVTPLDQEPETLARFRDVVASHDPFELAVLGVATSASGSLVVALALAHAHIDAGQAFEVSQLDETFQSELWGMDPEAERKLEILKADLETSAAFLELLRAG